VANNTVSPPMTRTAAIATDLLVGVVAGLAASFAMNQFQSLWAKAVPMSEGPTAAEEAADAMSEEVSGAPVRGSQKRTADSVVHYATGAVIGAVYGLAAGVLPAITLGSGLLFSGAVWLLGDELAVPSLRLGPPPQKTEARQHILGIASHIVFGLALDQVRRRVNALISPLGP
jgi:putative membrane protein